jgi:hypothetical protein
MSRSRGSRQYKAVRKAASLKRAASRDLIVLVALTAACLVGIVIYSTLMFGGVIEDTPVAQGVVMVFAVIIGFVSLRHSKDRRALRDYMDAHGLTDTEVKECLRMG